MIRNSRSSRSPARGIDPEVVVEVLAVGHLRQRRPAKSKGDFGLAVVADPGQALALGVEFADVSGG